MPFPVPVSDGEVGLRSPPAETSEALATFWSSSVGRRMPLSREQLAFLVIVLVGGVLRFWDLGSRTFHTDEALHAALAYHLATGRGFVPDLLGLHGPYVFELNALVHRLFGVSNLFTGKLLAPDPGVHGPLLFELAALGFRLLGASDVSARVAPAAIGTLLVGLPYFLRRPLGRTGAIAAASLLALSPSLLYYSRFLRHDVFQVFLMLLLVVATFRYLERRSKGSLLLAVAATSLAFCDKEDSYFLLAILLTFLLGVSGRDVLRVVGQNRPSQDAATDVLVLLGTLILPLFAAVPYVALRGADDLTIDLDCALSFVGLFAIGASAGFRWNRGIWLRSAALFWGIYVALNTVFFSDPARILLSIFGSLRYWIDQQGVARGGQPWFYYLVLLLLYEFLAVGVSLGGLASRLRHRTLFTNFLMYWCLASLLLWGWASEKMPWMVIEMAVPFCLLAGASTERLVDFVAPRRNRRRMRSGWAVLGLAAIATLVSFSVRSAVQASFVHGDVPVEMLVYTQLAPDVRQVMRQINRLPERGDDEMVAPVVVCEAAGSVELACAWYLRNYPSVAYADGIPPPNAGVVLAGADRPLPLGSEYVARDDRLIWWFPEDETYKAWTLSSIVVGLSSPSVRLSLWRYVLDREPPAPLGYREFVLYVRRDLADRFQAPNRPLAGG